MSGLRVAIRSLFTRPAFAAAITTIIKIENTRARFEQRRDVVEPVTDVPRIAVTEQINEVFARRIVLGGEEPAVQLQPVGGLKIDVLERTSQFAAVRFHFAVRLINLTMFKPAQHKIKNRQRNEQTYDLCDSPPRSAVGHGKKWHKDN